MRQILIHLLKLLEAAVPPPPHCHHALTYARYGNDLEGWEDRLALQVNVDGQLHCLFLDEGDLEKASSVLIGEITALIHNQTL